MNKSETVTIIRSLLSSTKCNYSICRLSVDFKKETGFDIPLFGYNNLGDFLQSIPDTVKVSGMYPIQQVSLVKNEKSAHIVSLVNRTRAPDCKKQTYRGQSGLAVIKNGIRNRKIQKSPDGIGIREKFKGKDISPETQSESTNSSLTCSLQSSDSKLSLKNFLNIGETVQPIDIKLHAKVGQYVEVVPEYIYTPQKFYFHFRKLRKKFAAFMDKLQIFYKSHEQIPEMTERVIKPKLTCAAFHKIHDERRWHRVEINEIVSQSHVIVTFIDYGYRAKVSKSNLKYLHRDFVSLPKQAVLGSLANIRPSKGKCEWSPGAVDRFYTLALRKDLLAGVVAVDAETCSMKVALSSTKDLELHVNDTLVQEGYAEFETEILDKYSTCALKWPISSRSLKTSLRNVEKTAFVKEGGLQSVAKWSSPTPRAPIFCLSDTFFDNKRLHKMFSPLLRK